MFNQISQIFVDLSANNMNVWSHKKIISYLFCKFDLLEVDSELPKVLIKVLFLALLKVLLLGKVLFKVLKKVLKIV